MKWGNADVAGIFENLKKKSIVGHDMFNKSIVNSCI